MRSALPILITLCLGCLIAAPAEGGPTSASSCGVQSFAYAGLQSSVQARGVEATLTATVAPLVQGGHVGGWIGLGGTTDGPNGAAEWIQVGLAAFPGTRTSEMYYEVTVAGATPHYVELASTVAPGVAHHFAVLEMAGRRSWWQIWVDGKTVSPPIYLPGSDDSWYPQAVAENWNGGTGACNSYSFRFSNVGVARNLGGSWQPLQKGATLQDPGYHVVPLSASPRSFLAASLH